MITFKEFNEDFSATQIANLKKQWATVKRVDPRSDTYKRLVKFINDKSYEMLDDLAKAKINFVSYLAKKALMDKHGVKKDTINKMYGHWSEDGLLNVGEDAPANAVGDGSNVALPPTHEPGVHKKKKKDNKFTTFLKRFKTTKDINEMSSKELTLQIANDGELYQKQIEPIIKNLARKKNKGVFDKNLAVKLFRYAVDNKVKELKGPQSRTIPGSVRNDAATKLLSQFSDEIDEYYKELQKTGRKK